MINNFSYNLYTASAYYTLREVVELYTTGNV